MSKPNGVADDRFDASGFEVPYAATFEVEAVSEAESTFGLESESPFAEALEAEEQALAESEADPGLQAEGEPVTDESLAWLDMEAMTGDAVTEAEEAEAEEEAHEADAESYAESEWEGEAQALRGDGEWREVEGEYEEEAVEAEAEAAEAEDFVGREESETEDAREFERADQETASVARAFDVRRRGDRARRFPPTRPAFGRVTSEMEAKPKTPQQKRWPCDATPPTCMTPAVSTGEFGIALQRFTDERCVNSKVPTLLAKSATFMARVAALDKKYVSLDGGLCRREPLEGWRDAWAPNANGVLTKGPFAGRRVLTMMYSTSGSLFLPSNAVDNGYDYDLIVIKLPDGIGPDGKPHSGGSASSTGVLVDWISAIAHETVHAHTFVTATAAPAATIPLRVAAAIREEAATRALEAKILSEIAATAGASFRTAVGGVAGSTAAFRVQRDFFPGEDRVTYLEHFVISERMLDAIRRARLKATDIERIDKEIDAIDLTLRALDKNLSDPFPIFYHPGVPPGQSSKGVSPKASFRTIATDYGRFRFWRRVMSARWKALETRLGRMPGPTDPAREKVAEEHLKAFFGGLAAYDAVPVAAPAPRPKQTKEFESEDVMHRSKRPPGGGSGVAPTRVGPSAPVPAWADAIDPFPAAVTVGLNRSNAAMTTAFAPVTVSTANHLCAAVGDVTGGGGVAPFAAWRENEMLYVGSLLKVGVMYAAFELRARVQVFADAARANGVTTSADLFTLIKRAWAPKLKALFPARPTQSFGNGQDVSVPQVDRIFTLSAAGQIDFAMASPPVTLADLDRVGEFGTPIGLFREWMHLMMRWSNNIAASRCVLALGYFYINGLFARGGFFGAGKGLWISGDYDGHDWVRTVAELNANAAGVALDSRWATAQKRATSNFVANAFQVGRLMTGMAQDQLIDAAACGEMRRLSNQMSGGIGSYARSALTAVGRTPSELSSKIGFGDDRFSHDCAIVERTVGGRRLRYASVVLGSAPAQKRRDLSDLFVLLDATVVARNP